MVATPPVQADACTPSARAREIIDGITDPELRRDVEATVTACLEALIAFKRIHLPQDHIEEGTLEQRADDRHVELAPYVLAAVASVNRLLEQLTVYPAPPESAPEKSADDFDFEFDLVDGPTGESSRLTAAPETPSSKSPREQSNETASALGGMLRSRVSGFVPRLKHALGQEDVWALLSELDELKHALTKSVQGLLFGMLGTFSSGARREEILPEYRSAVRESVELRAALTDLGYHVGRFNGAIATARPEQLVPLVVALCDRLGRFSSRPEYRTLRAEDKREIINFRRRLHSMRHHKDGIPVAKLRQEVEGFSKFLEAMQAINHREVLIVHDRQRLTECLERLEETLNLALLDSASARGRLELLVQHLNSVFGRYPELDEALRHFAPVPPEALGHELQRWRVITQAALATVG